MKKTYVLDTNVLIQSPHALYSFEDNDVVLPVCVLEELDKFKMAIGEVGANSRSVIRMIDKLKEAGPLVDGVPIPNGNDGKLRLILNCVDIPIPDTWDVNKVDNRILKVCKHLKDNGENAIVVSNDIIVRLKADVMGLKAEEFTTDRAPELDKQYTGRTEVFIDDELLDSFSSKKPLKPSDVFKVDEGYNHIPVELELNEFLVLTSAINPNKTKLGKFDGKNIVPLYYLDASPYNVIPKNTGQRFMQEALMDDSVPLVIVKGAAGTAKTFYSLAVGLEKVMADYQNQESMYRKILVCRPNAQFDDDIGFLPGDEFDKISPLLRPVYDNLEVLIDRNEKERYSNESVLKDKVQELFDRGWIETQALNFLRGRSIIKTWLIIDEAQNLTPKQAKGIITRAGKGTKVILIGDPAQIDNVTLDERTNGLSYASEKMKGSPCCYQLRMNDTECKRSVLAMDAASRM